jgi:drug/metabolite transporter (DMT)-like permease
VKPSGYFRLLLLAAIWGASFLFTKVAASTLGAFPTAFFRVLFGALGLCVMLAALRVRWDFNGRLKYTLALGVINSGIPFAMYGVAARLLPVGYLAVFNATTPLMGIVIGAFFFGEKVTARQVVGVVVGLAGVAILTATGPVSLSASVVAGALVCLVATGCYGAASFLTQRWIGQRGGLDAKLVACGSQIGATLLLAPVFGVWAAVAPAPDWGGLQVWLSLAAVGLICTAWGYILYFRLIEDIGPVRSLTVTFLIPPFGVLWGVLFLHEIVTWAHLLGGGLIAVALLSVLASPKPAQGR